MAGYTVDPASLANLANTLQAIGGDLNFIHDGRNQLYDPPTSGGDGSFDGDGFAFGPFDNAGNQLEQFAAQWSDGIALFNKKASDLAGFLQSCSTTFASTDDQLAKVLPGQGQQGG